MVSIYFSGRYILWGPYNKRMEAQNIIKQENTGQGVPTHFIPVKSSQGVDGLAVLTTQPDIDEWNKCESREAQKDFLYGMITRHPSHKTPHIFAQFLWHLLAAGRFDTITSKTKEYKK